MRKLIMTGLEVVMSIMAVVLAGGIFLLFSFAFGRRKCYYSCRFKEVDSWNMIFDILAVEQMTARRLARIG